MEKKLNILILISTSLGAFIVPFMGSTINVALPTISTELAMGSVMLNWVNLCFTLAMAICILPFGRLADIVGRKKILFLGMTGFAIASIISGFAANSIMLIIARALQGLSGGAISVTVVSILTSVFPAGSRGKALGLNVAMTYIGLSVGPFFGGLITKFLGWRFIFFIVAAISIVIVISLATLKQDWADAKGEKFDLVGSVIYGVSLVGIIAGFSIIRSLLGVILIILGLIAIIIFGLFESRSSQPLINMALLRHNRILSFSSVAALINYSATFALIYLLSLYLQYNLGLDPSRAGLVLMAQPVIMTIFSPIAGVLSDRIQPQKVASLGMIITTIGLVFFIFIDQSKGIPYIIISQIILGAGFGLFSSPNTNAVMSSVDKKNYGVASGLLGASRSIGQTLSMGIASLTISIYVGNAQISSGNIPELVMAIRVTFIILACVCFVGVFFSLARGNVQR